MIGILGGMGTQAGLDFCSKLAKLNRGKSDQNYPLFLLYNKSNIPDRKQNLKKYSKDLDGMMEYLRAQSYSLSNDPNQTFENGLFLG